ncbi:transcription termination factor NusA [Mycoplasmopsis canis]|uniref:transcription termination factor NusA n=1 Tax=Mycoplasmopsis canis TaxID=29555 RepID=UPI00025ADA28|nr:transcription termination factor NusA [Mycoplasmopsis canis]EIE40662.1 transcription termination factor NusA [Mycoplasmopsis canis UF33]
MRKKEETKVVNFLVNEQISFYEVLNGYAETKKLSLETIKEIFRSEIQKVVNKSFDPEAVIKIEIDEVNKMAKIINIKGQAISDETANMILEESADSEIQKFIYSRISELPHELQSKYEDGDDIEIEFIFNDLPQRSKAAILNGFKLEIKNAEQQRVQSIFVDKIGQSFDAEVNTALRHEYDIEIHYDGDHFRALLPKNKANKNKKLNPGSKIKVTLEKINLEKTASPLEVTMIDPKEVEKALKEEIFEIENGDIEIVKIERDAGNRTKVAVRTNPDREFQFDIIGSIFGEGAKRILAASHKVGESLDIIRYSDNKKEFIKNAISPIKPIDVLVTKNFEKAFVIVKNDEVTKAIGKSGINVELASKLTQIKIEVLSLDKANERKLPYNKQNLSDLNENPLFEKSLFKKTQTKSNKKSHTAKFLDSKELEIALSNFNDDLETFIAKDQAAQELIKSQKSAAKPNSKSSSFIKSEEINNMFDKFNNELSENDTNLNEVSYYDDKDNSEDSWNYVWDPEFAAEGEEFEDEVVDNNKVDEISSDKKSVSKSEEKNIVKEYKKIKDFKVDTDLASYGLDENIDLSNFDDEDWK